MLLVPSSRSKFSWLSRLFLYCCFIEVLNCCTEARKATVLPLKDRIWDFKDTYNTATAVVLLLVILEVTLIVFYQCCGRTMSGIAKRSTMQWLLLLLLLEVMWEVMVTALSLCCSDVYKANRLVDTYQDMLDNLFLPLFEATNNPKGHPELHMFLQHVSCPPCSPPSSSLPPLLSLPLPSLPPSAPTSWTCCQNKRWSSHNFQTVLLAGKTAVLQLLPRLTYLVQSLLGFIILFHIKTHPGQILGSCKCTVVPWQGTWEDWSALMCVTEASMAAEKNKNKNSWTSCLSHWHVHLFGFFFFWPPPGDRVRLCGWWVEARKPDVWQGHGHPTTVEQRGQPALLILPLLPLCQHGGAQPLPQVSASWWNGLWVTSSEIRGRWGGVGEWAQCSHMAVCAQSAGVQLFLHNKWTRA